MSSVLIPTAQIIMGPSLERQAFSALVLGIMMVWIGTPAVRKYAVSKGAVDDPKRDDRRVHREPLPRWGGIGIYLGILFSVLICLGLFQPLGAFPLFVAGVLGVGAILVWVGALDDLHQYPARLQSMLLLAAGFGIQAVQSGGSAVQLPLSVAWSIPLTAFYVFIVTKTMDTIDGVDGLAAGLAAVAASTLAIIGAWAGQAAIAIMGAAIAGSALGFLRHNWNPSKIIMGTGGAYILGFSLACMSIVTSQIVSPKVAWAIPFCIFFVPLFDAVFVITKRIIARVPISQGDKRHTHHTLLAWGLNQRQTVIVLCTISMLMSTLLLLLIRGASSA